MITNRLLIDAIHHRLGTDHYCRVSSGMVAQKKKENRTLRIEKRGKIGNFALKSRRKIRKSIVLSSTKIASLHLIRVIIKATSPQLVPARDLGQLSQLRRSENDQKRLVYRLRYAVIGMICFIDYRSSVVL